MASQNSTHDSSSRPLMGLCFGLGLCVFAGFCFPSLRAEPWKFLVYGDSRATTFEGGVNMEILREIALVTVAEQPDFVLFSGDLTYAGDYVHYDMWFEAMRPVFENGIPVYPIMGNHDYIAETFIEHFGETIPDNGPPQLLNRTYSFPHKNALFLALDTRGNRVDLDWTAQVLATNTLPHVFVMGHVPAFKLRHLDCLDDFPLERDAFWAILRQGRTKAYFCGHDHFYDHNRVDDGDGDPQNDIHHYTVATAGAPLALDSQYDGLNGIYTPTRIFHEQNFGYLVVEVNGLQVTTKWARRSSPGVYLKGTDVAALPAMVEQPRLHLERAIGDDLVVHITGLSPFCLVTVETLEDGVWQESPQFVASGTEAFHTNRLGRARGQMRVRMD